MSVILKKKSLFPVSNVILSSLFFPYLYFIFIGSLGLEPPHQSISNKLSKPKIWRVNPQKLALTVSLIHCLFAKNLLMNSSSLGLMTYCSLAKELIGIKISTHPLKYSIFTQQSQRLQLNHSRSLLSQTSLNSITIKIQTQIIILKLIKSEQKMKKKKQKNKVNLTYLSYCGEDQWWWRG